MKRFVLPILLALISLPLAACGGADAKQSADELSHLLEVNDKLSFSAQLQTEYPDRCYDFTVDYEREGGEASVTVVYPEQIAGISARVIGGATELEYDGLRLDVGELDEYGLTPMSALPVLVDTMQNGHLDGWWEEDGKIVLLLTADDHISATVWLEAATVTPMRAELVSDALVVVYCDISDWKAY